jgi:Icc-related predicted phosphoesterase
MKILVLSDLHLEHHFDGGVSFINSLDPTGIDVLIVAGDLTNFSRIESTLRCFCLKFKKVVYVNGNHELYGHSPTALNNLRSRLSIENLHWLENSSVVINETRFLGATLWFQQSFNCMLKDRYNDFNFIKKFEPWVYEQNKMSTKFFEENLTPSDVMITHFLPLSNSVSYRFKNSSLNCFFFSGNEIEQIVKSVQPKLTVHGHTHDSVDYILDKTRVVCNPFGYAKIETNHDFDKQMIIEV